ncbi:FAD-dependent monooxygenase [Candidimonas nitroreducens]|uniref:Monooxygenase n=1 Tax=Candidimonas nitroreducens TaxID=683354 RepID=A0A225MWE5_9BURK|nr:FAD-dependent monooxygenase [Candidimonas nitroreducens]OWT63901.1 monooxygenase [Candidimonas nitroreducens]
MSQKVIIAGAGIGGLSAALALLQKGIDVEVYEQATELKEVGAGIQISPNGSCALDALGAYESVKASSCNPERKEFRLWNTGKSWLMFDLGQDAIRQYGYPYLTVYRPDLLQALFDGVKALKPDAVHLSSKIEGCTQEATCATLTLEDGRRISGAALIGADGVRSVIRHELWGAAKPTFSGMVAWRGVIPMENLPAHLRSMVGSTWIGPGGHAVNYPLHRGKIMNFVGTIERDDWLIESWSQKGEAQECHKDFTGWHEDVQTLIACSPQLHKWALMQREPMSQWTKGRVTLLGDAAHATLPFLAQGAVQSIEDGVVLARCFEKYGQDIPHCLSKYEEARLERTTRMVLGAAANTHRFHSAELATDTDAEAYLQREWSSSPIRDRYDWLYKYNAKTVDI